MSKEKTSFYEYVNQKGKKENYGYSRNKNDYLKTQDGLGKFTNTYSFIFSKLAFEFPEFSRILLRDSTAIRSIIVASEIIEVRGLPISWLTAWIKSESFSPDLYSWHV